MEWSAVPYEWVIITALFAVVAFFLVRLHLTIPMFPRLDEGFTAKNVARALQHPACLRTLPEATALLDQIQPRLDPAITEGASDYLELELLLSKMASLQMDLLSPNGVVDATRGIAFETAHDRVAVAELCGMCMSHNVSPRDLDISFSTWRDRGGVLLRRLCTAAHLSESESTAMEKTFQMIHEHVYDVAVSRCLPPKQAPPSGGDVSGYHPEHLVNRRTYDYKYGGLSASGGNSL